MGRGSSRRCRCRSQRHLVGGEHGGRASARPSGDALERPGIVGRPHPLVHRGDAPRELVRLRLADEDRPRRAGAAQRLGVARRHVRVEHRRAVRRSHALRVEEVLRRRTESPRAPVPSRGSTPPRPRRLLAGPVETESREAADPRIDSIDPRGDGVQHVDRRDATRRVCVEKLGRAETRQLVHARKYCRSRPTGIATHHLSASTARAYLPARGYVVPNSRPAPGVVRRSRGTGRSPRCR